MTGYLLDTNILSEFRKGPRCHPAVRKWLQSQPDEDLFISVVALAEIRDGIERIRSRDRLQATRLEIWLLEISTEFDERILPVHAEIADRWGRLFLPEPLPDFDRLIAATALEYDLCIATRNAQDFERSGAAIVSPWTL